MTSHDNLRQHRLLRAARLGQELKAAGFSSDQILELLRGMFPELADVAPGESIADLAKRAAAARAFGEVEQWT